jgi:hypothetical protein
VTGGELRADACVFAQFGEAPLSVEANEWLLNITQVTENSSESRNALRFIFLHVIGEDPVFEILTAGPYGVPDHFINFCVSVLDDSLYNLTAYS